MDDYTPVEQLLYDLKAPLKQMALARVVMNDYPNEPDLQVEARGRYWGAQLKVEAIVRRWVKTNPEEAKNGEDTSSEADGSTAAEIRPA